MLDLQTVENIICEEIPQGYHVILTLERDAGYVEIETPMGEIIDVDAADIPLVQQLMDALAQAKEHAGEEE